MSACAGRCALIVGHPGHELRVWGWMRAAAPLVAILTDGSGVGSAARLGLSRDVCRDASASISSCFGLVTDAEIYGALLRQDAEFFLRLAGVFASLLVEHRIDCVVGDAVEGYNPTHDLCRLVIDRAVRLAARDREIANYAVAVVGTGPPPASVSGVVRIDLSPADLAQKLEVSRAYADAAGGTLRAEVDAMLRANDAGAFASEYLVPVDAWSAHEAPSEHRPFYETHGEKQVAAGHYTSVIRHCEHVWPMACALRA